MTLFRHVIWDFNGTLLDDVQCCVDTLNTLLAERKLAPMTVDRYRESFGFPVRGFYVDLGFDLEREDFGHVSQTYIDRYMQRVAHAAPHPAAHDVLAGIAARSIGQSVLSAMEQTLLTSLLREYALDTHLHHARGLSDLSASSKVELGRALFAELGAQAHEVVLVGDTIHDCETAQAIGCSCLLLAHGHQSRARIERSGATVVDSLNDVLAFLDRHGRGA